MRKHMFYVLTEQYFKPQREESSVLPCCHGPHTI